MPATATHPAPDCPDAAPRLTDVVVLGGGALGAATAWWLARSGAAVVLLEEGTHRALRLAARGTAWSAHPSWTPGPDDLGAAADAWRELEHQTGAALLTRTDALDHGDPARLAALDGRAELLDPAAAAARWPGAAVDGPVLLRRGAALQVRADIALAALAAAAVGSGAVVRYRSAVTAVDALDAEHVEVRTADARIRARRVVTTAVAPSAGHAVELRPVELHCGPRGTVRPGAPLIAHHDRERGLLRAVPCAQGHVAVGAGSWPDGAGDLRDHLRTWLPGVDVRQSEAVGPEVMSTSPARTAVGWHGPLGRATATALGSVDTVVVARRIAEQALATA